MSLGRLPGCHKRSPPSGSLPEADGPYSGLTVGQLYQLLGRATYPAVLDFSPKHFELDDDGFALNCGNVLKELYLDNNRITIISSISHFTKLQILVLDNNSIKSLSCQGLSSLIHLSAKNNAISKLTKISDMKKLVYMDLSHNKLRSNLEDISALTSLRVLNLNNNPLLSPPNVTIPLEKTYNSVYDVAQLIQLFGNKLTKLEYFMMDEIPNLSQGHISKYVLNFFPKLTFYNWRKITKDERRAHMIQRYQNSPEQIPQEGVWDPQVQTQAKETSVDIISSSNKTSFSLHSKSSNLSEKDIKELKELHDDLDSVFDNLLTDESEPLSFKVDILPPPLFSQKVPIEISFPPPPIESSEIPPPLANENVSSPLSQKSDNKVVKSPPDSRKKLEKTESSKNEKKQEHAQELREIHSKESEKPKRETKTETKEVVQTIPVRGTLENGFSIASSSIVLTELLGDGSLGETFACLPINRTIKNSENETDEKEIIIGQIAKTLRVFPRDLKYLVNEVSQLVTLSHPLLARVVGVCTEKIVCIITEKINGTPLYVLARNKNVSLAERNILAVSILSALIWLHKQNVLFGLFKSADILVDFETLDIKFTSFGMLSVKKRLLADGILFYPEYAPPETIVYFTLNGEKVRSDDENIVNTLFTSQADVYAFSIILWELYEHGFPHFVPSAFQLVYEQQELTKNQNRLLKRLSSNSSTQAPPKPFTPSHPLLPMHFTNTPAALIGLITKGMAFDPNSRPTLGEYSSVILKNRESIERKSMDGISSELVETRKKIQAFCKDFTNSFQMKSLNPTVYGGLSQLIQKPGIYPLLMEFGFFEQMCNSPLFLSDEFAERMLIIIHFLSGYTLFREYFVSSLKGIDVLSKLFKRKQYISSTAFSISKSLLKNSSYLNIDLSKIFPVLAEILISKSERVSDKNEFPILSNVLSLIIVGLRITEISQKLFFSLINFEILIRFVKSESIEIKGKALIILAFSVNYYKQSPDSFEQQLQLVFASITQPLFHYACKALTVLNTNFVSQLKTTELIPHIVKELSNAQSLKESEDTALALVNVCSGETACDEAFSHGALNSCIKVISDLSTVNETQLFAILSLMERLFCCATCRDGASEMSSKILQSFLAVMRRFPSLIENVLRTLATLAYDQNWIEYFIQEGAIPVIVLHFLVAARKNDRAILSVVVHLIRTLVWVSPLALFDLCAMRPFDIFAGFMTLEYQHKGDLLESICYIFLALLPQDEYRLDIPPDAVSVLFSTIGDVCVSTKFTEDTLKFVIDNIAEQDVATKICGDSFNKGIIRCLSHTEVSVRVHSLKVISLFTRFKHTMSILVALVPLGLIGVLGEWKDSLSHGRKDSAATIIMRSIDTVLEIVEKIV